MCLVGSKDFLRPWTEYRVLLYHTMYFAFQTHIFWQILWENDGLYSSPFRPPSKYYASTCTGTASITTFTMKFWWENAYCWFAVFFNYRSLEHTTHTYLGNLPTRIKGKNSYDLSIITYLYYLYLFFCYVQLFCNATFWVCTFQLSFCWAKSQKRFDHEFWGPHSQKDLCLDKWYITVSSTCQFASNLLTRFF